jgi:hypothetical protein
LNVRPRLEPTARPICKPLNFLEIRFNLKIGIGIAADLECDSCEIHLVITREQPPKLRTIWKRISHQRDSPPATSTGQAIVLKRQWESSLLNEDSLAAKFFAFACRHELAKDFGELRLRIDSPATYPFGEGGDEIG